MAGDGRVIRIKEVAGGPTPGRRIWNLYIGKEMVDWISEDLSAESIKSTLFMVLKDDLKTLVG